MSCTIRDMFRMAFFRSLIVSIFLLMWAAPPMSAEVIRQELPGIGDLLIAPFRSAPFPHPRRQDGHTYNGRLYPAAKHYQDNSVAVFLPKGFRKTAAVDFVVYFHGWHNNIRKALPQYRLAEQLQESGKNAVLVFPEGPCDAPDSFGGKLEEAGGFQSLMGEVIDLLIAEKRIASRRIGHIVLAGHSGAYRVIAFILLHGGLAKQVREVYLFDALYGQTEKYAHWIDHTPGRLLLLYTEDGGTKAESLSLMDDLRAWKIPFLAAKEAEMTPAALRRHRLVFLHSALGHDQVVAERNQFCTFLRSGDLQNK